MPSAAARDVGVLEHDDRRLAAQLQVRPLDVRGGRGGHRLAGAGRAGDRDHRRDAVVEVSAAPVARSPQTTLSTPGRQHPGSASPIRTELAGVVSDGLSTTVLPAASAGPIFQTAIIIG